MGFIMLVAQPPTNSVIQADLLKENGNFEINVIGTADFE